MSDNVDYIARKAKKRQAYSKYIWVIPIGVLLLASVMKIVTPEIMAEHFEPFNLEHPNVFILIIGLLELSLVITFLIPATRVAGFLLLTAFIGGIIATESIISGSVPIFPIFLQIALWMGTYFEKKELITHLLSGKV